MSGHAIALPEPGHQRNVHGHHGLPGGAGGTAGRGGSGGATSTGGIATTGGAAGAGGTTTLATSCGNATLDPGEQCDCGTDAKKLPEGCKAMNGIFFGDGSGCARTCTREPSCLDATGKTQACTTACGDGNVDPAIQPHALPARSRK